MRIVSRLFPAGLVDLNFYVTAGCSHTNGSEQPGTPDLARDAFDSRAL